MTSDNFGFVPDAPGAAQAPVASAAPVAVSAPTPAAASATPGNFGFVPDGSAQTTIPGTPPTIPTPATGGGSVLSDIGNGAKATGNFLLSAPQSLGVHLGQLTDQGIGNVAGALGNTGLQQWENNKANTPQPNLTGGTVQPLQPGLKGVAQVGGDALATGAMLAPTGPLSDAASGALSSFLPKAAAGVLGRVGTNTAIGAVQGLAGGMQGGQNSSQIGNSAQTGAVLGTLFGVAGEGLSGLVNKFASNTPTSQLEAQTARLKTLQNAVADSNTNPIETIATALNSKLKVVDGKVDTQDVENEIENNQNTINTQAKKLVSQIPGSVPLANFKNSVIAAVKNNSTLRGAGAVGRAISDIGRRFDDYQASYGENISYPAINEIRTSMNKYFDPETVDVERAVADTARQYLYDSNAGGTTLKTLMGQWGQYADALNFAQKLRGTAVAGGRLGKLFAENAGRIVGGIAGASGGPIGAVAGGFAGGVAADKAMSMYQKSYFNPILTKPAQGLSRFISAPATQAAARVGQAALIPQAVQ